MYLWLYFKSFFVFVHYNYLFIVHSSVRKIYDHFVLFVSFAFWLHFQKSLQNLTFLLIYFYFPKKQKSEFEQTHRFKQLHAPPSRKQVPPLTDTHTQPPTYLQPQTSASTHIRQQKTRASAHTDVCVIANSWMGTRHACACSPKHLVINPPTAAQATVLKGAVAGTADKNSE